MKRSRSAEMTPWPGRTSRPRPLGDRICPRVSKAALMAGTTRGVVVDVWRVLRLSLLARTLPACGEFTRILLFRSQGLVEQMLAQSGW